MRAVLDASVILAAVWRKNPRSASRVMLEAAAAGAYQVVITDEVEAEYREVLARDKLRRGALAGVQRVAASLMEALVGVAERVEPTPDVHVVADDPKDDKYVAAALGGRAGWVVTLDRRHMLALGAYESVRFVTPGDFLAVLRLSTSQGFARAASCPLRATHLPRGRRSGMHHSIPLTRVKTKQSMSSAAVRYGLPEGGLGFHGEARGSAPQRDRPRHPSFPTPPSRWSTSSGSAPRRWS